MKKGILRPFIYTAPAVAMAIAAAAAVLLCSTLDSTEAVKIAFSNYPVTLSLKYGPYDISGCDSTYNGENPNVLFSALRISREVQAGLLHLDDYPGGREALCNQCLMVTDLEGIKSIMVRLIGDCPSCMENELRLSPAAYEHLGDGYGQMDGFFSFTDCPDPDSKEAIDKFGPLKGRSPGPVPKIGL